MATMKMPMAVGSGGKVYSLTNGNCPNDGVINCGFQPKHIIMFDNKWSGGGTFDIIYDYDDNPTQYYHWSGTTMYTRDFDGTQLVASLTSTGFTIRSDVPTYLQNNSLNILATG